MQQQHTDTGIVTSLYRALERLLVCGLGRMAPRAQAAVRQRVLEGRDVSITVRMGMVPYVVCTLVCEGAEPLEVFRADLLEFGAPSSRSVN